MGKVDQDREQGSVASVKIMPPREISSADAEKMNGHSLNGRNLTMKPVNRETTARVTSPSAVRMYTDFVARLAGSTNVTAATSRP